VEATGDAIRVATRKCLALERVRAAHASVVGRAARYGDDGSSWLRNPRGVPRGSRASSAQPIDPRSFDVLLRFCFDVFRFESN
jgi:hypothetical protein